MNTTGALFPHPSQTYTLSGASVIVGVARFTFIVTALLKDGVEQLIKPLTVTFPPEHP